MKRFARHLALFVLALGMSMQVWATLPQQQQAHDKAELGKQITQLLRKSTLWESSKGRVELIVRVLEDGRLELLDIDGEQARAVLAIRVVLALSRVEADAQLTGKAFHFVVEEHEATS
jgi:hypothetical protein